MGDPAGLAMAIVLIVALLGALALKPEFDKRRENRHINFLRRFE